MAPLLMDYASGAASGNASEAFKLDLTNLRRIISVPDADSEEVLKVRDIKKSMTTAGVAGGPQMSRAIGHVDG
eukprot:3834242-Pyramimonas_sp.AAC.1